VQELGEGMILDEDQLPSSELLPAASGPVGVLLCSKPVQPEAMSADESAAMRMWFFMFFISDGNRPDFARPYSQEEKVYQPDRVVSGRIGPQPYRTRVESVRSHSES
jgi:hypothetical protein